jgi:hypothetical protein
MKSMCLGTPFGTVPQRLMQRMPSVVTFRYRWNFTLSVELKNAVNCWSYILSSLDDWRSRRKGWNDADWGNRSIRSKTCPIFTGVSQIAYRLVWEWIRVSAIRGRRLTARPMAGSLFFSSLLQDISYLHWNSCGFLHLVWAKAKIVPQ